MTDKFDELREYEREYKEKLKGFGQEAFGSIVKEFCEANPGIIGVGWEQYTPYFNDGESCEFRVGQPWPLPIEVIREYLDIEDGSEIDLDDLDGLYFEEFTSFDRKYQKEELLGKIESTPNALFLQVFGDHVSVLITADGEVRVSDCNHE